MYFEVLMQNHYDAIILGSGLGGLATAAFLVQKKKKVLVLEKHNQAGGYATNFQRKDFDFDVALHSFDGMCPGSYSHRIIEQLGIVDDVEFIPHQRLYKLLLKDPDMELVVEHGSISQYIDQLSQLFPKERANLENLFKEMQLSHHHVGKFLFSQYPYLLRLCSVPLFFNRILRYEHDTVDKFLSRFIRDELLKRIITCQWSYYGLPPRQLAYGHFGYPTIDYLCNGGYSIKGGSKSLANALSNTIKRQGGDVLLSSLVTKVEMKNGKPCAIRTKKGQRYSTDHLISNINPFSLVELIGKENFSQNYLENLYQLTIATSGIQVYLGLDKTDAELGLDAKDSIIFVAGKEQCQERQYELLAESNLSDNINISLNLFSNVDPTLVPEGHSSMGLFSLIGGKSWQDLPKRLYRQKKAEVTEQLIERAEGIVPNLSKHIVVCETGSPRTMHNFTHNTNGSIYGFAQTVDQNGLFRRFPQRYPMKNTYQVGQWTFPGGGYIAVLASAKILVDRYF